jgi:hypothetical protein
LVSQEFENGTRNTNTRHSLQHLYASQIAAQIQCHAALFPIAAVGHTSKVHALADDDLMKYPRTQPNEKLRTYFQADLTNMK